MIRLREIVFGRPGPAAAGMGLSRLRAVAIVAGLLATMWSSLSNATHQLAYFNEAAGGSENGHKHLLGSNFDWGQDLLLGFQESGRHNCNSFFLKGRMSISNVQPSAPGENDSLSVVSREALMLPPENFRAQHWQLLNMTPDRFTSSAYTEVEVLTPTLSLVRL